MSKDLNKTGRWWRYWRATPSEAAEKAGISRKTLYNYIRDDRRLD